MRKMWKVGSVLVLGAAVVALVSAGTCEQAQARPPYLAAFGKQYENLAEKTKEAKCTVCHPAENNKKKEIRNVWGKALEKALGGKNVKDKDKIVEALTKAEKEKSAVEGKTFGDLIKDGKLPASEE